MKDQETSWNEEFSGACPGYIKLYGMNESIFKFIADDRNIS